MNGALPFGSYTPGVSPLHRMDARAKLGGFLFLLAAVILADGPPGFLCSAAAVCGLAVLSRLSLSSLIGVFGRLWLLFVSIFVLNALFFAPEVPIWRWWIFTLSYEGIRQGLLITLRTALSILLANLLTGTTPPMEITGAIEAYLRPLHVFGLPVEEISMILGISMQFIPILSEEADGIRRAQTARGARFDSGNLFHKAAAVAPLAIPIFIAAFRRADDLSLAMEARGYRGARERTKPLRRRLRGWDCTALAICIAFCAIQLIWRIFLGGY